MVVITSQEKWNINKALKNQLHSEYFNSIAIKFLNEVSIAEGTLLFFYCLESLFSLGAVLLDKQDSNRILLKIEEPVWRSSEKIKPINITINDTTLTFFFKLKRQEFSANFSLNDILGRQKQHSNSVIKRVAYNPILKPIHEHAWESSCVFNAAALYLDNKVHFIYRAIGDSGVSVLGYASSQDGIHIDERLAEPIFLSETPEKLKLDTIPSRYISGGSWCGCEDPRVVAIDDTIYMTYTAFDGYHAPGVALTSIKVDDFLNKRWNWKRPVLLSPLGEIHKNWVIFPEKINGKYALLHSLTPDILIDYFDNLNFHPPPSIKSNYQSQGRDMYWDNWVRGVGSPPMKTEDGWLVLYHAMDKRDPGRYKIGAMLLDKNDPTKILYRSATPLIEPDENYENEGFKPGVVYSCGAVIKDKTLFVYYGAADTVICAAYAKLEDLLTQLKNEEACMLEVISV